MSEINIKQKIVSVLIEPEYYNLIDAAKTQCSELATMLETGWKIKQISTSPYRERGKRNESWIDVCLTIFLEHE